VRGRKRRGAFRIRYNATQKDHRKDAGKKGDWAFIGLGQLDMWNVVRFTITRRLRLYDFRHALAIRLLAVNADSKAVAELIGHANVQTTLMTYNHVTAQKHRAAIYRMAVLDF
jgi:integrase